MHVTGVSVKSQEDPKQTYCTFQTQHSNVAYAVQESNTDLYMYGNTEKQSTFISEDSQSSRIGLSQSRFLVLTELVLVP